MKRFTLLIISILIIIPISTSCRKEPRQRVSKGTIIPNDKEKVNNYKGFYLLNEGNFGSNAASLGFFNFSEGEYHSNVYVQSNPSVVKELGDVGNDIAIYKGRLYMIINASNKIEVCNAYSVVRIGQINIPNCRKIAFDGNYTYITSYAGPIQLGGGYKQLGYVAKVDINTLEVVSKCIVGYQPDGIGISNGKIYVANSGGYLGVSDPTKYERTVSVISLKTFTEEKRIDVAYNLNDIQIDKRGDIWVSSRGNYKEEHSRLFFIDKNKEIVTDTIKREVGSFTISGDSIYVISNEYSSLSSSYKGKNFYIVDAATKKILDRPLIDPKVAEKIEKPYGIAVNPVSKDIYITDAGNYVSAGVLYCFDNSGKEKWHIKAGQIPAHFAFLPSR